MDVCPSRLAPISCDLWFQGGRLIQSITTVRCQLMQLTTTSERCLKQNLYEGGKTYSHKITRSHNHSQIYCHPHQRKIAGQWALKQDHVWLAVIDPCWPIAHVATFANPWFLSDVKVARFANLSLNFESGYCLNRFDIFQNLWKIPADHKRPCGNICKSLIFSDVKAKMSMWQFWNYVSFFIDRQYFVVLQWLFAGTITTKPQLPLEEFKMIFEVGSRLDIEGFQKAKGHCWSAALFKSEMSKLSFVTFKRLLMILPCQSVLMLLRPNCGKSLFLHYEEGIHKNKSMNIERLFFHMINLMLKPSYKMPNPSHCSRSFQEYLNLIAIKIKLPWALTSNQLVLHVTHF